MSTEKILIGQNFDGQNCRILGVSVVSKILSVEIEFCKQIFVQNCRKFGSVSNILSVENFCPTKILFVEILSDKVKALFLLHLPKFFYSGYYGQANSW